MRLDPFQLSTINRATPQRTGSRGDHLSPSAPHGFAYLGPTVLFASHSHIIPFGSAEADPLETHSLPRVFLDER